MPLRHAAGGGRTRLRLFLAFAGAGVLSLLIVLVFPGPSRPTRSTAPADRPPSTEGGPDRTAPTPKGPAGSAAGPEEDDDDRAEPIPGTERWHYEKFLRLAAADPDEFARLAAEKTGSGTPLQERVAFLRAALKLRGKDSLPWFADALAAAEGTPDRDALLGFVVRYLAPHARAVPEVRDFLWERVFLNGNVNARERSAAARAVLEVADAREIGRLVAPLPGISDAAAVDGALVGLGTNDHTEAASALAWISSAHPEKRVRDRAAEITRQRLAGKVGKEEER